jgi:integrase
MALAAGDNMKGLRDRALLLIGFAGAFRRSELVALNIEDLEESELGFKVTIGHSKTDQEGAGQTIAIVGGSLACPVAALKAWLEAAGIASGPIFRSVRKGGAVGERLPAQSVADIVKFYPERAVLDPTFFAGHSVRSGFLTRFYEVALCAPVVVQSEVSHEARSDRCRKRLHFGCDRWGGDGECTVLSPLRPCSNLYLASLYPPKPQLGSPRGRSAHCSVFQPEQSGSHRRW